MADLLNFIPPPHPKNIILDGRLIRLAPLNAEQHAELLFYANTQDGGAENWTYLPYGPFETVSAYAEWLQPLQTSDDPCFFTLIRKADNRPVGLASYLRISPKDGSIEVGHIHFSPLLQQTTEATEAMYLMMKWAFEAGYRRYEWKCNARNAKSRGAAQRLGLSYEGVFRQATISKGENRDTAWFAAIDSEWPALEKAFTAYLQDANFRPDGRPKVSLTQLTKPVLYKQDNSEFM